MVDIKRHLNQTLVLWVRGANDGYGGYTYSDPVEVDCRWSEVQERFINGAREEKISNAIVQIDQDINLGDMIYLGTLNDLDSADGPGDVQSYPVQAYKKIPNLKGSQFIRKVFI